MNFFKKLEKKIHANQSLLCIGLDPMPDKLPAGADLYSRLINWCNEIVEKTSDLVCCYKPNIAFFEQFGPKGLRALADFLREIPEDVPLLLDAKRGDIGSTADAYARGAYGHFRADAITLSPYLGRDSIDAFLKDPDKTAFVLCHTSNPSASEIQHYGDPPLFEYIADLAKSWGSTTQIGFVIGATQPEALQAVRRICPDHWFLAPGVGAQGGDLDQALQAGLRADGLGMIIPVSRAVINAPDPRQAALDVREAINLSRTGFKPEPAISRREMLIIKLFEAGCVRFGSFTLASGKQSPIYFDLRRIGSFPDLFTEVVHAYLDVLSEKRFDLVAGVPYAALPLGGLIAWKLGTPLIYPRKEAKSHGTGQMVEGAFQPGQKAVLVEDVITSGGSILAAAEALRAAGLVVEDAVVLVDRKQGGDAAMAPHGIHVHAVTDIYEILTVLKSHGLIDSETEVSVKAYLQGL